MKLLYIDSDLAFAANIKRSLERRGVDVELFEDGRDGVDAARSELPDAIVLAVELGEKLTGGYTWCQKLKKDDQLRHIPLVLVSSQATPETFEQHKKLKNRAEEYLQKPFNAASLLEAVGNHVSLPPEAVEAPVTDPGLLAGDDDLEKIDEAFDALTAPDPVEELAPTDEGFEIALAEDLLDHGDAVPAAGPGEPAPAAAPAWPDDPTLESEEFRAQLATLEARLAEAERELAQKTAEVEASRSTFGGRDRDYFQLRNEAARKDKEILRLREDLNRAERESLELREAQTALEQRLVELEAEVAHKDALSRTALQRAEGASAGLRRAESTIAALRVEATRVPGLVEEVERLSELKTGLAAELEGARADAASLGNRVAALEDELAAERERSAAAGAAATRLEAELASVRDEAAAADGRHRAQVAELEARVGAGEEAVLEAKLELEATGQTAERARQALTAALAELDGIARAP